MQTQQQRNETGAIEHVNRPGFAVSVSNRPFLRSVRLIGIVDARVVLAIVRCFHRGQAAMTWVGGA